MFLSKRGSVAIRLSKVSSMSDRQLIRVGIIGITGRMGREVARLIAERNDLMLVGAISSSTNVALGKTLKEAGICNSEVKIMGPDKLEYIAEKSQVIISFTNSTAEMKNLPIISKYGRAIVVGTTGFTDEQLSSLKDSVQNSPLLVSYNFSIGANVMFHIARLLSKLPKDFEISIIEAHHSGKLDAPSGTAKRIADIIMKERQYTKIVTGRQGESKRQLGELELLSIRAGGIVGKHTILAASQNELIAVKHESFSRSSFANGALMAATWLIGKKPGFYTMEDVLGFA
jgi:4-hydroxy-tetrahydrodipicolinate reductase